MYSFIISIIGSILVFLIARAIFETFIGVGRLALGLMFIAISYILDGLAWSLRSFD